MLYTPDHHGIGQYLQHSPELRVELHRRALLGLSMAVALAPENTGATKASGHVTDDGPNAGFKHDRMGFSIVFDTPYAVNVTYRKTRPNARDYLLAAMPVIERGA